MTSIKPKIKPKLSKDGSRHVTDEFYNTLIMIVGAILAVIGVSFLLFFSAKAHKPWHFFSFLIYGLGLINIFIMSALHHGINASERTEHILRQLDYFSVFLMIGGSFTPFCLIAMRNRLGLTVLAVVWVLAIAGIILKALIPDISKWIILPLYLGMGWMGALIALPLYQMISAAAGLILLGGYFYTAGSLVYFAEAPNPLPGRFGFHEIWHLHVLAGAASHFFVLYWYFLPL